MSCWDVALHATLIDSVNMSVHMTTEVDGQYTKVVDVLKAERVEKPITYPSPKHPIQVDAATGKIVSVETDRQTSIIAQCMVKCGVELFDRMDNSETGVGDCITICVEGYKQAVKELNGTD